MLQVRVTLGSLTMLAPAGLRQEPSEDNRSNGTYSSLSAMLMTRRVAHEMMYLTMSLWLYLQAKCKAVCPFLFTDCSEYPCSCSARNCKKPGGISIIRGLTRAQLGLRLICGYILSVVRQIYKS